MIINQRIKIFTKSLYLDVFALIFAFSTLLVHLESNIFLNFAVT